ncbi:hypothetical protein [Sediminibacterium soli]|uniref:hypothetical protein n=1 Tax=Sediminibacterium soli TaxID=2698829 RepID=UPI00137B6EF1|nr:hypothetical protein [Sediminibacterium soli]NCI46511.1 hypothetical protein [Sediminibacterium soli]
MQRYRCAIIVLCSVFYLHAKAQIVEVDYTWAKEKINNLSARNISGLTQKTTKIQKRIQADDESFQLLRSGIIDYLTNGGVQASARFLKLNIGEEKFSIPFYIYTGTSGTGFGNDKENSQSVNSLLNQLGGTLNFSINQSFNLLERNASARTLLKFNYHLGTRLVNGRDSLTQESINYLNSFANAGLYFQTGAWANDDMSNIGMFFLQAKISGNMSAESNFARIFGPGFKKNSLLGYSVDMGIEIDNIISLRAGVYQYTNSPVELLAKPVVKFAVNYKLN